MNQTVVMRTASGAFCILIKYLSESGQINAGFLSRFVAGMGLIRKFYRHKGVSQHEHIVYLWEFE